MTSPEEKTDVDGQADQGLVADYETIHEDNANNHSSVNVVCDVLRLKSFFAQT